MTNPSYATPPGGLPPQSQLLSGRAVFSNAYAVIPGDVMTDIVTGEDLANAAIVPLHQDLATLATLGIGNAERNGHHYLRGITHLSDAEREAVLHAHPSLYTVRDGVPQLNVENGKIDLRSLQTPGYALGAPIDYDSMTPLDEWSFGSLSL